jgi:hypothetical protein
MLGYLDPIRNAGQAEQWVYYSNVRVVELSPYIIVQARAGNIPATNYLVTQFSSLTFTSSATFATAPITNKWFKGTGTFSQPNIGVPTSLEQSNSVNATSMNDTFAKVFNNANDGTNYMNVYSDPAGSVTSRVVAVTVVLGPTNKTYLSGATTNFLVVARGPSAPTSQGWRFNTVSNYATATNLVNTSKYGATTNTLSLFVTNIGPADIGYYWCGVTNTAVAGGAPTFVVPQASVLSVTSPPPTFTSITPSGGNMQLSFTSPNPFDTSGSFALESSGEVTGPYTNNPAAITGTNPFSVSVPQTGDLMFYRLKHN